MSLARLSTWPARAQQLWPGLAVSALVMTAAMFLADHYHAPVMLFALLLGMAVNFLSQEARCKPGIEFAARQVLRWGVALLGLRITGSQVQALGWQPILMVLLAVATTIGFGLVAARLMGFKTFFGVLSGGAVAICGTSAAMAIAAAYPQDPKRDRATLFVVISVSTMSTMAMVLYPILARWISLDPQQAGMFLGGTIHDVAQVVGAGYGMGQQTGDVATVVKLMRVAMLLPVIVLAACLTRMGASAAPAREAKPLPPGHPPLLPGFALAFVALVLFNSLLSLPTLLVESGGLLSTACLVAAMAAIGMKTHLKDILGVGWKPVALVVLETLFLALLVLSILRWLAA